MNTNEKTEAINFFYPFTEDIDGSILNFRSWRGFEGLHDPSVPGRLYGVFFECLRPGLHGDKDKFLQAIKFLRSTHRKFRSQAGRGEFDVDCVPTEQSIHGAILLERYLGTL